MKATMKTMEVKSVGGEIYTPDRMAAFDIVHDFSGGSARLRLMFTAGIEYSVEFRVWGGEQTVCLVRQGEIVAAMSDVHTFANDGIPF